MKIYIDSGNIDEIKQASQTKLIDGVTTNPSLLAKEGKDAQEVFDNLLDIIRPLGNEVTLSAEVTDVNSVDGMILQGREFAAMDERILVKVPLTQKGLQAVKQLSDEGIRCNVTLCFSANQALLAAKAGAWCVSPFLGRVDDEGYDGVQLIAEIKQVFDNYGFETKILAASIRSTAHVSQVAQIGADMATIPFNIFEKMYYNPLTEKGVESFNKDWEKLQQSLKK